MPKLLVSEKYNFMDEVEQCASDPGKIALKWVNESSALKKITYRELATSVHSYARALYNLGLRKGDRVLLISQKVPESYCMYLACLKSRASFHSMFGNVTSQRPAVPHQSFRSKSRHRL